MYLCARLCARGRRGVCVCVRAFVCLFVFVRACEYARARVCARACVWVYQCLAQSAMSSDTTGFSIISTGAAADADARLARWTSGTTDDGWPWVLVSAPLSAMLAASGVASSEFMLAEGDGGVGVLVARDTMDPERSVWDQDRHGVICGLWDGAVVLDGAVVRASTPGMVSAMAVGESVRVDYLAATRMISVVWRGRTIDLCALPHTHDITHYRFGVVLSEGNAMRMTGATMAGAGALRLLVPCRARMLAFPPGWRARSALCVVEELDCWTSALGLTRRRSRHYSSGSSSTASARWVELGQRVCCIVAGGNEPVPPAMSRCRRQ
jgi:hypothetical protein